ncbi:MAG: class I SAM-dependent methyltransferase [Cyanobacteriota bacterium]|nr:class I SAM-dependent methyltransferase [Cyanobacteriota bacterium]
MDEPLQAEAYAQADFALSDQAFTDHVLALVAAAPATAAPPRTLELGCGPGNISFRLAEALPQVPYLATDGAPAMLSLAQECQRAEPQRWPQLRFHQARLPLPAEALHALPDPFSPPYDLIVSNHMLHHFHDPAVFWQTVRQWAAPGALVVVRDLLRPPSREALQAKLVFFDAEAPPVLRLDYANSLAAAFTPQEVEAQVASAGLDSLRVEVLDTRYVDIHGRIPG